MKKTGTVANILAAASVLFIIEDVVSLDFLPTTIYLWLIHLTASKALSILLLKLLE
jgi:hypothetical protein